MIDEWRAENSKHKVRRTGTAGYPESIRGVTCTPLMKIPIHKESGIT